MTCIKSGFYISDGSRTSVRHLVPPTSARWRFYSLTCRWRSVSFRECGSASVTTFHSINSNRPFELYPHRIRTLLERVVRMRGDTTEPENVEASVGIWGKGVSEYASFLRERELDSGMYDALVRLFKAGVDAGLGEEDWTRIANMFMVR